MPQGIDPQVQRLMDAGASDDDIVFFLKQRGASSPKPPAAPKPTGMLDRLDTMAGDPAAPKTARVGAYLASAIGRNPVQAGAMAGGALAAPFTGGMSWPAAMAASGAGGTLGAGVGQVAGGKSIDVPEMLTEGAGQALGEGTGRVVGAAGQLLGRGLYRAGLLPINSVLGKYGDVVKTGVENAVPVTQGGAQKALRIQHGAQDEKAAALALRDRLGITHNTANLATAASVPLDADAAKMSQAALGNRSGAYAEKLAEFTSANPASLKPSELEALKNTWDNNAGLAFRKIRGKEPLSPDERFTVEMTGTAKKAQQGVWSGYSDANKRIMDSAGLAKAIQRRTQGSGGNQGLENAMFTGAAAMGNMAAIPARLAMLPPVLSGLGIATYKAAQHGQPGATAVLKALLSMIGGSGDTPTAEEGPIE